MLIIYQDRPSLSYCTSLSISFYEREITPWKISDSSNIVPRRVDNSAGRLCARRKRESEEVYCKINTFNAELRYRAWRYRKSNMIEMRYWAVKFARDKLSPVAFANGYTHSAYGRTCVRGNRVFYDDASNIRASSYYAANHSRSWMSVALNHCHALAWLRVFF